MSKGNPIIKFRDAGEGKLIQEAKEKLGLNNDSAAIRVLLKLGCGEIDKFISHAKFVTHPLKYSEIDFFTTTINIILKKHKRELQQMQE